MADSTLYTNEAAERKVALIVGSLVSSKVRLFRAELTLTVFTTKVELVSAECDFEGYPVGGIALAAWTGPSIVGGGGRALTSPLANFATANAVTLDPPNQVGGWWVEDATGNVRLTGTFSPVRPMTTKFQTIAWISQIVEGFNMAQG